MDVDADYGQASRVDESWVLPAVTEFGGFPEVTADGDIIYTFEDMQVETNEKPAELVVCVCRFSFSLAVSLCVSLFADVGDRYRRRGRGPRGALRGRAQAACGARGDLDGRNVTPPPPISNLLDPSHTSSPVTVPLTAHPTAPLAGSRRRISLRASARRSRSAPRAPMSGRPRQRRACSWRSSMNPPAPRLTSEK